MHTKIHGSNIRTTEILSGAVGTGAGGWFTFPREKVFQVRGITTATVNLEYKTSKGDTEATLYSFTADGARASSDPLGFVRANVTAWTSGTITVSVSYESYGE